MGKVKTWAAVALSLWRRSQKAHTIAPIEMTPSDTPTPAPIAPIWAPESGHVSLADLEVSLAAAGVVVAGEAADVAVEVAVLEIISALERAATP